MLTESDHHVGEVQFDTHDHDEHELLWGANVQCTVEQDDRVWVVPPMLGVWIPAGVMHGGFIAADGTYYCTFFDPCDCPIRWSDATPVAMPTALRELILHVHHNELDADAHARAERVVLDMIRPVALSAVSLTMPFDERARTVASQLVANPADDRSLAEWSRSVGASTRNLTRLFDTQTGLSFTQWRAHARISAALTDLARGTDVATAARRVGYNNASAFTRTFKLITGQTPSAYFARSTAVVRHDAPSKGGPRGV